MPKFYDLLSFVCRKIFRCLVYTEFAEWRTWTLERELTALDMIIFDIVDLIWSAEIEKLQPCIVALTKLW
jgi:hypothetical protein